MFKPVAPQPDFPAQEEEILAFWEKENIFQKSVQQNEGKPVFVVYDGPPTANAKPPLHTIVPMSFKDLVGRYQTMRGRYVPRQAGWDTHGLPVEVQVERALGLSGKKEVLNIVPGDEVASIRKFNEICRTSVWEFKQDWDKFVPRVGYWTDTKNPYITYDSGYIEKVWGVFQRIWDKGLVFKDYKVVPYCPRCGTGLSAAEVAQGYEDVKDTSVYVSFPLTDRPNTAFLAWTTTPWTLPGNVALAVGKDIEYVEVAQGEKHYILAKSRLEVLKGEYEIITSYTGADLVGLTYQGLYPEVLATAEGKKFLVVAADFVSTEDGTGIVHTAVMYGEDDFNLGKAEGLASHHSVGLDGRFLEEVSEFAGLYVRDALVPILQSLTAKDRLYAKQVITHSYPHCWRCKTPLVYYAKDSWYIGMSKLRSELIKSNEDVEWFPDHIKEGRFGDFVREARDWSVSRERFWGTPLPIWESEDGENWICVGSFEQLKKLAKNPELIGGSFDPHRPLVDEIIIEHDGKTFKRQPYVLDVWFDSGSMPYASGRVEQGYFPADYIAEAVDQTRGWFYSLMAIATILEGRSSYKRVVCMGHLVDENGRKMSKSLGNTFDPWDAFKICGVDAIRWFLITVNSPGEAKAFGTKELQTSFRKSILLLWNIFNYHVTYANTLNFQPLTAQEIATLSDDYGNNKDLTVLDRWILSKQAEVSEYVTQHMDSYDFMRAGRALEQYINDLSTWYLRRSRKRTDEHFFKVLHAVLMNLVQMMAPLTPFVTEKIYQILKHADMPESVHLTQWVGQTGSVDQQLQKDMEVIRKAVELGLSVRAAEKIKVRQPLRSASINIALEKELLQILADELNVLEVIPEVRPEDVSKQEGELVVGLHTTLDDELIQAGASRELLRQIQNLRKNKGLQPGQTVELLVGPSQKATVEPLLTPEVLADAFLVVGEETWTREGDTEIEVTGETVLIGFANHVE